MGIKKKTTRFNLRLTPLLICISYLLFGYLLFKPALSSYFFQDDWFTFKISNVSSLADFLTFFVPRTDVIYYRPLGMQVFFFIMHRLFEFNPVYYRLIALLTHSFNSFLIYYLLTIIGFRKIISYVTGIFFITSTTNFIPLFWSSTFPFILGVTLFLLALIFYIKNQIINNNFISLLFFLLGLFTFEIIAVFPIIILFWEIIIKRKGKYLKVLKYFILTGLYLSLRILVYKIPLEGTYKPNLKLFSTLRTYILWSLNWPEEMSKQFIKIFTVNPQFYNSFFDYVNFWLIGTIILTILILIIPLIMSYFVIKTKTKLITGLSLFGLTWFLICLIPLFLFSEHTYSYYLPVGLIGLLIFFSVQFEKLSAYFNNHKTIKIIYFISIVIVWFSMSNTTIKFNLLTFWVPKTACQSHEAISKTLLTDNNILEKGFNTFFISDARYRQALNDQDALQVIFNNHNIKTVYKDEKEILSGQEVIIEVADDNCTGLVKKY